MGKIFGGAILLFLGIPLLIGMIWAVGLTRAVLDTRFFTQLSDQLVEQMPTMIDNAFNAASDPQATQDPNTRTWLDAMARVTTRPSEMLAQVGVLDWLNSEVRGTLRQIDKVFDGELRSNQVTFDMRPLKRALTSPEMHSYLKKVVANLPACNGPDQEAWLHRIRQGRHNQSLPACNPGEPHQDHALTLIKNSISQVPDQLPVFHGDRDIPPFVVIKTLNTFLWLLFLLPVLFIVLGTLLVSREAKGFLRVSGTTVMIGSGLSLLLSAVVKSLPLSVHHFKLWSLTNNSSPWFFQNAAGQKFILQLTNTTHEFLDGIFSPVVTISWIIACLGILLVGLSFLASRATKTNP